MLYLAEEHTALTSAPLERHACSPVGPRLWRVALRLQSTDREPTLLFEFVRLLFTFTFQTPAFELLFQLPPTIGASISKR